LTGAGSFEASVADNRDGGKADPLNVTYFFRPPGIDRQATMNFDKAVTKADSAVSTAAAAPPLAAMS
jgi:hypothetical protein